MHMHKYIYRAAQKAILYMSVLPDEVNNRQVREGKEMVMGYCGWMYLRSGVCQSASNNH